MLRPNYFWADSIKRYLTSLKRPLVGHLRTGAMPKVHQIAIEFIASREALEGRGHSARQYRNNLQAIILPSIGIAVGLIRYNFLAFFGVHDIYLLQFWINVSNKFNAVIA